MSNPYLVNIWWSDEDGCFIATAPALKGCMTHGKTREEAARHIDEAIELWLESAKENEDPIPVPDAPKKKTAEEKEGQYEGRHPTFLHF